MIQASQQAGSLREPRWYYCDPQMLNMEPQGLVFALWVSILHWPKPGALAAMLCPDRLYPLNCKANKSIFHLNSARYLYFHSKDKSSWYRKSLSEVETLLWCYQKWRCCCDELDHACLELVCRRNVGGFRAVSCSSRILDSELNGPFCWELGRLECWWKCRLEGMLMRLQKGRTPQGIWYYVMVWQRIWPHSNKIFEKLSEVE